MLRYFTLLEPEMRDCRLCEFLRIAKAKDLPGPKIVQIHMRVPGGEIVVTEDGEAVPEADLSDPWTHRAYLRQLEWTNGMMKWVVDSLLSDPEYSPVIVIQGDHGFQGDFGLGPAAAEPSEDDQFRMRMGIMNAYLLPNGGNNQLYPSISSVNTFRLIFNYYLDANFDLLENRSYHNVKGDVYEFRDVTDIVSFPR